MKIKFEQTTCKRCQGKGGIDSFLHVDGGRCFSCGGSGKKLTKKGLAEKKVYVEAHTIQASEVKPGMTIIIDRCEYQVLAVETTPDSYSVFGNAVAITLDGYCHTDFQGRTSNVVGVWESNKIRLSE
jgi:hypothetical protein